MEVYNMETFKTTREIHEYLLAGGKVVYLNKNNPVFFTEDGMLNRAATFDWPSEWSKYIEPKVPVKYSVELWVKLGEVNSDSCNLDDKLGFYEYNRVCHTECPTKVRITVEELG